MVLLQVDLGVEGGGPLATVERGLDYVVAHSGKPRPDGSPVEAGVEGAGVVFDKVDATDPKPIGGDVVDLQALIGIGSTSFDYHSIGFGNFGVREGFVSTQSYTEPGSYDQRESLLEVIIE